MRLSVFFLAVATATAFTLSTGPADALDSSVGCYKRVKVKKGGYKHKLVLVKAKCTGPKGRKGRKGEKGDTGRDGADGRDGRDGPNGVDGVDGKDGTDGSDGSDGSDGRDGADGRDGRDGRDGEKGEKGDKGEKGNKGDPSPPGVVREPVTVPGEAVTVPASGSAVAAGGECPADTVLVSGAFTAASPVLVRSFQPSVRRWQGAFSSGNGSPGSVTVSSFCMPTS
ncbi:hypothetical protein [Actinocorallia aurantiaca]